MSMFTPQHADLRSCRGPSRRELLKLGGLSLFGLGLPDLIARRDALAVDSAGPLRGKSKHCIVLFMLGGPPQHETWDPKPDAPVEVRGDFGSISASAHGIRVGELMPLTARQMDWSNQVFRWCKSIGLESRAR